MMRAARIGQLILWNDPGLYAIEELEELVVREYLRGLNDAGWHGDPGLVRLGYMAGAALNYGIATLG